DKYGDLDGIFEHVDEQSPKLRENLAGHEELVRENAIVMELIRDVDLTEELPGGLEDLAMRDIDAEELRRLFDFLEFHSLFERLTEALGADLGAMQTSEVLEAEVVDGSTAVDAVAALEALDAEGPLGVAGSFDVDDGLEGLA